MMINNYIHVTCHDTCNLHTNYNDHSNSSPEHSNSVVQFDRKKIYTPVYYCIYYK